MTPPKQYYATYLEVVNFKEDEGPDRWFQRQQWIVMPKIELEDTFHAVFTRIQNFQGHRAIWRAFDFANVLNAMDSINTAATRSTALLREPIVVQLTPAEMIEYVGHPAKKTPWQVLNRATKVARKRGYKL